MAMQMPMNSNDMAPMQKEQMNAPHAGAMRAATMFRRRGMGGKKPVAPRPMPKPMARPVMDMDRDGY